jgi:aspartate carbamoyltransferase catalytic subunit
VPIINAGDGGQNHPTQTLTDLLTLHREFGQLHGLTIGLCGDLKFGRTVHSLIAAMARYPGVHFVLVSPKELVAPDYVIDVIKRHGATYEECRTMDAVMPKLDALYMTRVQRQLHTRHAQDGAGQTRFGRDAPPAPGKRNFRGSGRGPAGAILRASAVR